VVYCFWNFTFIVETIRVETILPKINNEVVVFNL